MTGVRDGMAVYLEKQWLRRGLLDSAGCGVDRGEGGGMSEGLKGVDAEMFK